MKRNMPWSGPRLVLDGTPLHPLAVSVVDKPPRLVRAKVGDEDFLIGRMRDDLVEVRALLAVLVRPSACERNDGALPSGDVGQLRRQRDGCKRARAILCAPKVVEGG